MHSILVVDAEDIIRQIIATMTLRSLLSIVVISSIILHVYSETIDQKIFKSDSLTEDANFFKLLEMIQHENAHARHLMNFKKSLDSKRKSIPSTVYKRMKTKVLDSLKEDFLRRRALYDEQVKQLKSIECHLNTIPVEVPYPTTGFSFPAFIELNQCIGGCGFRPPYLIHCAPQEAHPVYFNAIVFDGTTHNIEVKKMFNHTKCGCQCTVQEHHCNNETETYDAVECKCKCKFLPHKCDQVTKQWDTDHCGCKCIYPPYACSNTNKLWSSDTCDCQCRPGIESRCKRKNKLLNSNTCECYCSPNIKCPTGTKLNKSDCTCSLQA
ncbi:uncharacterized protein LOC114523854 [Dendronephthya gigantea]|uniref:uncharacterized protein LOC114523854 n=1 Tax=Dendronephthya gigantea TaxID=151771 RepID=UPI00106C0398|nr:uncharacterized protein LOC114523854 [Dendronephthya gigantea]